MNIAILQEYCESLKLKFALLGAASPEDQLKPAVAELIQAAGASCGQKIDTLTEAHLSEIGARPDLAVYLDSLICGYIELKAPGMGADAPNLPGPHNKAQWKKLKSLPNLIYTDGQDWALYRNGVRPEGHPIVRFREDPVTKGKAAVTQDDAVALQRLFRDFLGWKPNVPHSPDSLAKFLAPLTRFLRSEVESAISESGSSTGILANEWRQYFFPDAGDTQFADAYAQTVTYAMLLARLSGAKKLSPTEAANALDKNNGLLARTLELIGHKDAMEELRVGIELLQRSLEALDPDDFLKTSPDLWLYFYEDFLRAYDPKLRKNYGVYYTPREVVDLQVRLADELLSKRFGKNLGFADDGVIFLDPAVGTGTYPASAIRHGLEKVRKRSGPGAVTGRARQMAQNMHGFEILVGPYAVAHLRLKQALEGSMNATCTVGSKDQKLSGRLKIYLADTLESPYREPEGVLTLTHAPLTQEHEAARKVKLEGDVLVCLGNPPYDRQMIDEDDSETIRKGGWVRFGNQVAGGASQEKQGERPIFADFTEPGSKAGAGIHLKNLYNDYVYFWRWALWRLFEQQDCGGIITFITASSYLAGPGFVGMRKLMRQIFDELWIIDLGGDNIGARKTPNVFNIKTPVAVAIGIRAANSSQEKPAKVRYKKIVADSRKDKLKQLEAITNFDNLDWQNCPEDWQEPFVPAGKGDFFEWPAVEDIFPLVVNGAQYKRSWPIGETIEVLHARWAQLVASPPEKKAELFRETDDWKISKKITLDLPGHDQPPIRDCTQENDVPKLIRYAYRSFDRHYALYDFRLGDRLRPTLYRLHGDNQVYFTTQIKKQMSLGAALVAAAHIPDLHCFHGRGGRDVIPLYCDSAGAKPNVTNKLLEALGNEYGTVLSAEDLAAYVYALLGGQSYSKRFWHELETPGPRVPITKNHALFIDATRLGSKLIWFHTYAERYQGAGRGAIVPSGEAKLLSSISDLPSEFPEKYDYENTKSEILVGEGRFGPVSPEVWEFEVSGMKVVQKWLGYRMKKRSGKKSSPLDDIRPERWTPQMSDEFLELLWVLEATISMESELEEILEKITANPCFAASELPKPSEEEKKPPVSEAVAGDLLGFMDNDDIMDDDDDGHD